MKFFDAARNKLTIPIQQPMIDLVDDDENSHFVENNDSHVEAAVGGTSNIIERMKKRVTRTIMSKDTTPESKKNYEILHLNDLMKKALLSQKSISFIRI